MCVAFVAHANADKQSDGFVYSGHTTLHMVCGLLSHKSHIAHTCVDASSMVKGNGVPSAERPPIVRAARIVCSFCFRMRVCCFFTTKLNLHASWASASLLSLYGLSSQCAGSVTNGWLRDIFGALGSLLSRIVLRQNVT